MIFTIFQNTWPGSVAITFNDSVCTSELVRLVRVKGCVHSTEYHKCPSLAGQSANFIAAQSIASVNSNSHNVPSRNATDVQLFQRFVNDYRIAK